MTNQVSVVPVVLSGGVGSRLWPLSRKHHPKQMHRLVGERTMLQNTLVRIDAASFALAEPVIVGSEIHVDMIQQQVADVAEHYRLILEPVGRNTAPAIALAAENLCRSDCGEHVMVVMPADHAFHDEQAFCLALEDGVTAAADGAIVTFGVLPTRPHTGYGYIESATEISSGPTPIARFVEKPDLATAEEYLRSGRYLWNSGIFVFRADRFLEELRKYAPDIAADTSSSFDAGEFHGSVFRPGADEFAAVRSDSIDYALMEHTEAGFVVPMKAGWSDVGSWLALHDAHPVDENGNALEGDVIAVEASNTFVRAGEKLIAICGVSDLIVVDSADAILITRQESAERVKDIVETLKKRGRDELL